MNMYDEMLSYLEETDDIKMLEDFMNKVIKIFFILRFFPIYVN